MIRRIVLTAAAPLAIAFAAALAGAATAQPYAGEPDPYALPPGYNQVTGYDDQQSDGPPPAYDEQADPQGYYQDAPQAAPPPQNNADSGQERGGYYNSGTGAHVQSSYNRQGYVRGGESYSSRERNTSQEAYTGGTVYADDRGGYATTGTPVYVDENGVSREGGYVRGSSSDSQSGYSTQYDSRYGGQQNARYDNRQGGDQYGAQYGERSGYSNSGHSNAGYASQGSYQAYGAGSARFGYQRRFYAFSVAEEQTSSSTVVRDDFGYVRRYQGQQPYPYRNDDLHLDGSSQLALTGGVEGDAYVSSSSGGGGYATASASSSAGARAGAFAGARGGRGRGRGHHGHGGHGCGCRR